MGERGAGGVGRRGGGPPARPVVGTSSDDGGTPSWGVAYLSPVRTMPCMKKRCAKKKISRGMIIVRMDAAWISWGSELYRPLKRNRPTAIGLMSALPAR